jgi:hypothetical protein
VLQRDAQGGANEAAAAKHKRMCSR